MKKRVIGLSLACIGVGMLLAVLVPVLGWVLAVGAILIIAGYILTCC